MMTKNEIDYIYRDKKLIQPFIKLLNDVWIYVCAWGFLLGLCSRKYFSMDYKVEAR